MAAVTTAEIFTVAALAVVAPVAVMAEVAVAAAVATVHAVVVVATLGLYHPLDGDTNLKYKLLCFLIPNKKDFKEKDTCFNPNRCCHLALCLHLLLFHRSSSCCDFSA